MQSFFWQCTLLNWDDGTYSITYTQVEGHTTTLGMCASNFEFDYKYFFERIVLTIIVSSLCTVVKISLV